jgi:chromosome transmission fidelity protein 1
MFRDHVLARVRDLEELHTLGANNGICSYFGTRRAVSAAHLITMPCTLR